MQSQWSQRRVEFVVVVVARRCCRRLVVVVGFSLQSRWTQMDHSHSSGGVIHKFLTIFAIFMVKRLLVSFALCVYELTGAPS